MYNFISSIIFVVDYNSHTAITDYWV